jgi:antitoxin component YwqK of YwqJK toxin-antitoxin module
VQVWYENRQKRSEAKWKDGKLVTIVVWKPNGEKCPVTKVVNGNGNRTWYNEDGTEDSRYTFKDGELVKD